MRYLNKNYRFGVMILALGLLTACGYAEWPPRDNRLRDVNASQTQPRPRTATAFVGASAVVVGKGDSVYGLSKRHKVPMRAIIEANGLVAPFVLHIGQRLELPRGQAHTIKRGDTLFAIATLYDVNAFELARINGLKKPYVIHVGNLLVLPSSARVAAVTIAKSPLAGSQPSKSNAAKIETPSPPGSTRKTKPDTPTTAAWVAPPKRQSASAVATQIRPQRKSLAAPTAKSRKGFLWPVSGKIISNYGVKSKGLRNDGINIQARRGNAVLASENGIVAYAGNELRGFGNLLLIKHAGGWVTAYAHNEQLLVKRGQQIKRGQKIATIGSTGNVSSPQLHFEIRQGNKAKDPKKYLRGKA